MNNYTVFDILVVKLEKIIHSLIFPHSMNCFGPAKIKYKINAENGKFSFFKPKQTDEI